MKNKKATKNVKVTINLLDTKAKKITAIVIAAVVFVLVVILLIIESNYGKLIVKNKTDINLEYVKTSFVNTDAMVTEGVKTPSISANKTYREALKPAKLARTESNLEVRFKFENSKELFTDVGFFNIDFKGNIVISFLPTKDPNLVKFKIKAGNGFFQSVTADCNEVFTIDLSKGVILE